MTTRSRKTTSPGAARAARPAAAGNAPPTDGQQRQLMLLTLERKFRNLMHSAQELTRRLADPTQPRARIESCLAESGLERQAIQAQKDAIEAGEPFAFPDEAALQALRDVMGRLESGIAQTAATEALILATIDVVNTVRQG